MIGTYIDLDHRRLEKWTRWTNNQAEGQVVSPAIAESEKDRCHREREARLRAMGEQAKVIPMRQTC